MSDFISILVTNTMYSIIRGDYSWWLWCSVGIRGDDLRGDLVPHVSRVGLGTLHVRMSHNCLCAWCELRVCRCCVLGDYLWSMNHILVENCWWQFGEYWNAPMLVFMNHEISWWLIIHVYAFDYDWCEANPQWSVVDRLPICMNG